MRKSVKIALTVVLICAMICIFALNIFAADGLDHYRTKTVNFNSGTLAAINDGMGIDLYDDVIGNNICSFAIYHDGLYYRTFFDSGSDGYVWLSIPTPSTSWRSGYVVITYPDFVYAYDVGSSDEINADVNINRTFWQIVSSPFIFLQNMLNFEFFGINLFALVTSVLTLILVAFIFKKIYRGL